MITRAARPGRGSSTVTVTSGTRGPRERLGAGCSRRHSAWQTARSWPRGRRRRGMRRPVGAPPRGGRVPPGDAAGRGSSRPRSPPAGRWHRPPAAGRQNRRRQSAARPGRLAAGGPPRGPRTSHGRERARSGRETLPPASPAGAQHGTPSLGAHAEAKAVGLGALAVVRLVRTLQRRASSRRPRAARGRGPRGRRKPMSLRLRRLPRNAEPSLGKTLATPCGARIPVLRCAPRSAMDRRSNFPGEVSARPSRRRWACS